LRLLPDEPHHNDGQLRRQILELGELDSYLESLAGGGGCEPDLVREVGSCFAAFALDLERPW
jgi:hypothetical protein